MRWYKNKIQTSWTLLSSYIYKTWGTSSSRCEKIYRRYSIVFMYCSIISIFLIPSNCYVMFFGLFDFDVHPSNKDFFLLDSWRDNHARVPIIFLPIGYTSLLTNQPYSFFFLPRGIEIPTFLSSFSTLYTSVFFRSHFNSPTTLHSPKHYCVCTGWILSHSSLF